MWGEGVKQYRRHLFVVFAVTLTCLTGAHGVLQNALADMRFGWLSRKASGQLVIVSIDSRSIRSIGTWPWSRALHGTVVDNLERAGATDIAFDVDFSSPSQKSADEAFAASLKKAGGSVILAGFEQPVLAPDGRKELLVNEPIKPFRDAAWVAPVNVAPDNDGVVRQYPLFHTLRGDLLPSLASALVGSSQSHASSFWVDYSINADDIPTVSYVDVLNGRASALAQIKDKKVIVGGTALELGDRFNVPGGRIIAGPRLQALAAESILQRREMQRVSEPFALISVGCLMLFAFILCGLTSPGVSALSIIALAATAEAFALLLQGHTTVILDTSLLQVAGAAYLVAIALEEIDVRGFLRNIAENRFERITMSLGDGLVCFDKNGRATLCNPSAAQMLGYTDQELIGRPIGDLFVENLQAVFELAATAADATDRNVELEGRRKNGETFPADASVCAWDGSDGRHYGVVFRDVSARKREEVKIRYLAEYDTLTDLANRHSLHRHLDSELAKARTGGGELAVLLIDLDTFKEINDSLGHAQGDRVLVAVSKRLRSLAAEGDLIARLGGDEFAIVISGGRAAERAWSVADKIGKALGAEPIVIDGRPIFIQSSIGVALFPDDAEDSEHLLGNADLALYQAKAEGRGCYVFFHNKLRTDLESRLALEDELSRALGNGEFQLYYQPKIDLKDNVVVGAEALIRWQSPTRGLVSPAKFMPIVNASVLSRDLGRWVLETAAAQAARWELKGCDLHVAVNLSASQIRSGDLSLVVKETLQKCGLSARFLQLEVTEDIVIENEKVAIRNFQELQEIGVRLAFDDFGTGYAGLSYLKKFPLDILKIDRSFVTGLTSSSDDRAIVAATIAMSQQLGLAVVAEGIEDLATADLLRGLGCQQGQGYFFGKPMPADEFEKMFLTDPRIGLRASDRADAA